jgi:hypothetical protein
MTLLVQAASALRQIGSFIAAASRPSSRIGPMDGTRPNTTTPSMETAVTSDIGLLSTACLFDPLRWYSCRTSGQKSNLDFLLGGRDFLSARKLSLTIHRSDALHAAFVFQDGLFAARRYAVMMF